MAEGLRFFEGLETDSQTTVWEFFDLDRNADHARSGGFGAGVDGLGQPRSESPLCNPTTAWAIGFAFRSRAEPWGGNVTLVEVRGPGDYFHVRLSFNAQHELLVETPDSGGGFVARAYGSRQLDDGAYYYVEMACYASMTSGRIVVQLDGGPCVVGTGEATIIDVSGIPTLLPSTPVPGRSYNQFHMGAMFGFLNEGHRFSFDDIYVRDLNVVNEFMGDIEVIPIGLEDDYTIEWVRNILAKNYLTLIETTPDEDATEVETAVAAKDLYEVENSVFPGIIHAVQVVSRGRKTSTDVWKTHNLIHVAGDELVGPDFFMAYPFYETFPPVVFGHQPNGSEWTLAAFNAMKVGIYAEPVL